MPFAIALDAALALFKRYKSLFVILPLATLLGLSHCSDKRHTRQRDEARAQIVELKAASAANLAAQQAQVKALEAKLTEQAKDADNAYKTALEGARNRAADYAERNRVPAKGVYCRPASGPGESPVAPRDNGPGATAVVLPRDDYDILVENSARLEAAHRWAKSLIEDGTAEVVKAGVPEVGFGGGAQVKSATRPVQ